MPIYHSYIEATKSANVRANLRSQKYSINLENVFWKVEVDKVSVWVIKRLKRAIKVLILAMLKNLYIGNCSCLKIDIFRGGVTESSVESNLIRRSEKYGNLYKTLVAE